MVGDRIKPAISVVIPFFNANQWIDDTLCSILKDGSTDIEVIIVEDLNSSPVQFSLKFRDRVKVIRNFGPLKGAGYVRWLGVQHSHGDFIAFLDADDLRKSGSLVRQKEFMVKNNLEFSFMGFKHFSTSLDLIDDLQACILPRPPYDLDRFLKKSFVVPCLTVMISHRAAKLLDFNLLKRRNDYFMWFNLIVKLNALNWQWSGFAELGGYHRLHSGALTNSRFKSLLAQYIFYRKCGFSICFALYLMCFYVINTIGTR